MPLIKPSRRIALSEDAVAATLVNSYAGATVSGHANNHYNQSATSTGYSRQHSSADTHGRAGVGPTTVGGDDQSRWQATLPTSSHAASPDGDEAASVRLDPVMCQPQVRAALSVDSSFSQLYVSQCCCRSSRLRSCVQGGTNQSTRQVPIGRGRNPYFRHGDAIYPFVYVAVIGGLCYMRLVPGWLLLLLLVPLYIGGVQLVIIKGEQLLIVGFLDLECIHPIA